MRYLVILLLSGCSTWEQPFTQEPGDFACVKVNWTDQARIQNYCARGAQACGTVGNWTELQQMWVRKPRAFDDHEAVCVVGHEFLHNLGARHK